MDNQLALVLSPGFVEDLSSITMDDVRTRRTICQQFEAGHSLLRRLIQGRLDILGSELSRRRDGGATLGAEDLLARLPDILSEQRTAATAARPPAAVEPEVIDEGLATEFEGIISPQDLSDLSQLDDDQLSGAADALTSLERRVSEERRSLHERIDAIQAEVMRRYRTGEATVDGLLS